ncbi:MAG: outer membrane protein assembly factor BamB family protein [Candidatus Geothermincolia bacterium]
MLKRSQLSGWKIYIPVIAGLIAVFGVLRLLVAISGRTSPADPPIGIEQTEQEQLADSIPARTDLEDATRGLVKQQLAAAWQVPIDGNGFLSLQEGRLYVTTTTGEVQAYDAATGAPLWAYDTGAWIASAPALSNGMVYTGSSDHNLYALDAATGGLVWYFESQGEILASPVTEGNLVFFCSDNNHIYDLMNRVYCLDAASGMLLWYFDTAGWSASPPTAASGQLYLGCYDRKLYALDQAAGGELWDLPTSSLVFGSPVALANKVFGCTIDGRVYAADELTGTLAWVCLLREFIWLPPVAYTGPAASLIYVSTYNNAVYAVEPEQGDVVWACDAKKPLQFAPQVQGEHLLVIAGDNRLYRLQAATGTPLAVWEAPAGFSSTPSATADHIYACCADGYLRAYPLTPPPSPLPAP